MAGTHIRLHLVEATLPFNQLSHERQKALHMYTELLNKVNSLLSNASPATREDIDLQLSIKADLSRFSMELNRRESAYEAEIEYIHKKLQSSLKELNDKIYNSPLNLRVLTHSKEKQDAANLARFKEEEEINLKMEALRNQAEADRTSLNKKLEKQKVSLFGIICDSIEDSIDYFERQHAPKATVEEPTDESAYEAAEEASDEAPEAPADAAEAIHAEHELTHGASLVGASSVEPAL